MINYIGNISFQIIILIFIYFTFCKEEKKYLPGYDYPLESLPQVEKRKFELDYEKSLEFPENKVYMVTGDIVNLREKPSVKSKIIRTVKLKDEFLIKKILFLPYDWSNPDHQTKDDATLGWLETNESGKKAYLSFNYATPKENCKEVFNALICNQLKLGFVWAKMKSHETIVYIFKEKPFGLGIGKINSIQNYTHILNIQFISAEMIFNEPVIVQESYILQGEAGQIFKNKMYQFISLKNGEPKFITNFPVYEFYTPEANEYGNSFQYELINFIKLNEEVFIIETKSSVGVKDILNYNYSPKKFYYDIYVTQSFEDLKNISDEIIKKNLKRGGFNYR